MVDRRNENPITMFVIDIKSGKAERFNGTREQKVLLEKGAAVLAEGSSPLMALLSKVVSDGIALRNQHEEIEYLQGRIDLLEQLQANAEAGSHTPG